MKKFNSALILLLFIKTIYAQNPLVKQWDHRFGGINDDALRSLLPTLDKGYILGGYSLSDSSGDKTQFSRGGYDYWIVKVDSNGIKEWDKRFGGTGDEYVFAMQQTNDNGYIIGGYSSSDSSGDKTQPNRGGTFTLDYWIVKIDSMGNKQWDKRFGGTKDDLLRSLQQTNDGGFILGGYSNSGISGDKTQPNWDMLFGTSYDYWIVKIDSIGNKEWDKRFGGTYNDELFYVQQTTDMGFILGGWSNSGMNGDKSQPSWGNEDYWIVKIDSIGVKEWDKRFGGNDIDELSSMQNTTDGGFILGGTSYSGISGDKTHPTWGGFDYWIVKIDSLGNKKWDNDFGANNIEALISLNKTNDDGYLLSGYSQSGISGDKSENNLGLKQTWIVKSDSVGNKQWEKTIFTTGVDEISFTVQSSTQCYISVNYTNGGTGGYKTMPNWDTTNTTHDYWIVKFCDTTLTTSINQIPNSQPPISIYPNPTNATLHLSLNIKENIIITNLLGEIVLKKNAKGKVELDVSFLSSGIYFIKAGSEVRKFVKE